MSERIAATLPVFSRYLQRIPPLLKKADARMLSARLSEDGFTALEHFRIAQGYVLRSLWPVLGRVTPVLRESSDASELVRQGAWIADQLALLEIGDFAGADARRIRHRAGEADLEQEAEEYVLLYGLPNFLFHLCQGYAALRMAGAAIGKADFDGFHIYPPGGHFGAAPSESMQ